MKKKKKRERAWIGARKEETNTKTATRQESNNVVHPRPLLPKIRRVALILFGKREGGGAKKSGDKREGKKVVWVWCNRVQV